MNSVLIIDDEEKLRGLLARIIRLEGYEVLEASSLKAGKTILDKQSVDILLCDVRLPDGNGIDFITAVKNIQPSPEIILLTAYGNIPDAVQAMKNGAFDYITKGDDNDKIIPLLSRIAEKVQLQKRVQQLEQQLGKRYGFENILGNSPLISNAVSMAKKVAPTDASVLLLGETGTGKEVFAQAIHHGSNRTGKPFVALNCSAFSKELLESELFGHTAGAFTGALKDKKGLIEEANNGTLFLDEIGEMHIDLQAKLLRVLETNDFIKVGDTKLTKVSVRIIAATNRNLQEDAGNGKFRADLFYRLNVFTITLPSLSQRPEDIPLLAGHFLKIFTQKTGTSIQSISAGFLSRLQHYSWKGNIRELKNIIERAVILNEGNELLPFSLPVEIGPAPNNTGGLSAFSLASIEKLHIQRMLNHTKGNKTETARLLDIGLTTLYRKIEEYKIITN